MAGEPPVGRLVYTAGVKTARAVHGGEVRVEEAAPSYRSRPASGPGAAQGTRRRAASASIVVGLRDPGSGTRTASAAGPIGGSDAPAAIMCGRGDPRGHEVPGA